MTLTLTLNKEFLHPVFIVSNRRPIACYIHISGFLVYCCKKYKKNCFKICQILIFSTFWKLSKSAYFNRHVLLMCVI